MVEYTFLVSVCTGRNTQEQVKVKPNYVYTLESYEKILLFGDNALNQYKQTVGL